MSKTCWEASLLFMSLYDPRDNAVASTELWSFNTVVNHDAHASNEDLFELPREKDTVVVAYANCYCFSDITKLS